MSRGCASCALHLPCLDDRGGLGRCGMNGLGLLAPSEARYSSDPDAGGLGALPGPGLLDSLQATAVGVFNRFLVLEAEIVAAQAKLTDAEAMAQRKNQGKLLNEVQGALRAASAMLARFHQTRDTLQTAVNGIAQMLTNYAAGRAGLIEVAAYSAQLSATLPWTIRAAQELLVDVPRFTVKSAELVERVRAANVLNTPVSVPFTTAFGLQNLVQLAPWVVAGIAAYHVLPGLMKRRRV